MAGYYIDKLGYHFHFGNKRDELSLNSNFIGECLLRDVYIN